MENRVTEALANQRWIDNVANPLHRAVKGVLDRVPKIASVLRGEVIGHPLHPALVTVPIGAWTVGVVLDLLEIRGSKQFRAAADASMVIGLAGAAASTIAGLADWSKTDDRPKRIGFFHAATNTVVAGLYGASVIARFTGQRKLGIALSITGAAMTGLSGWLGGELAYRYGVGVHAEPSTVATKPARKSEPKPRRAPRALPN